MNQKEFNKYLYRDGGCVHCAEGIAIVPHHRLNRGMGGSKERDTPSNIVTFCSAMNSLVESDSKWYHAALKYGWKLRSGQEPSKTPIWFAYDGKWFLLDDQFGKVETTSPIGEYVDGQGYVERT
jgi:hypothetical protein